jgi:hypothetical protein
MKAALRSVAAVVAGLLVLFALLVAVELFSAVVHPFPADFGGSKDEMCQHVARYPHWVLGVVVPLWAFAAYASTWIARTIGNLTSSVIVGLLLLAALAWNVSMLPYPVWFKVAALLVTPLAVVCAARRSSRHEACSSRVGGARLRRPDLVAVRRCP